MKSKKAAMEMTVGTIVTIVLLMTALVLGLILTYNIFKSAKGAIDLTDQQLMDQIGKAFGSDTSKLAIYPQTATLDIKQEAQEAMGLGIRNLLEGVSGTQKFSYGVVVADKSTCGNEDVLSWIYLGKTESNIPISVGSTYTTKISFKIPSSSPLCTVRYRVDVTTDKGQTGKSFPYDSIQFDITSKAK
jgi:hypothetical protein